MKLFDCEFSTDRLYDREHVWLKKEGDLLRIGVTDFFQKMANEIVFVELPATGRTLETSKPFVSLESGKWVGRVKCTVAGTVVNANGELKDFPYLINESPYGDGWMIDIKPNDANFESALFDLNNPEHLKEYEAVLDAEKKKIASMSK
jgi:glycine cleavage system H protein